MAAPSRLQNDWSKGMAQDFPRNNMPKGYGWNFVDYLPRIGGASVRERGGWTSASNDIALAKATASYVVGGIYPPTWGFNVVIDEDGEVYKVVANGTVTDVAAGVAVKQNPIIHRDKVIAFASGGATAPKKITNSAGTLTVANLGGSPPNAQYGVVFNDYTAASGVTATPNRLFFSDPGDPESWDTTNSFWDMSQPVNGLVALRTALITFHDGYIGRIRGTTPPPGSDFIADDPLFAVGTSDVRSIAVNGDRIVFANGEGIFMTDGSGKPANLTRLAGMSTYYQTIMSGYDSSSWTLAGGFVQDGYMLSIMNGTAFVDCFWVCLDPLSFWRHSNIDARTMWQAQGTVDRLYFGRRGAARVGELSTIFMPSATVRNDGNGTAVASTFESAFYQGDEGGKSFKRLYVDYELTDYGTDDPDATIGYITTPEDTTYTTISDSLAESSTKTTRQEPLNLAADGVAIKIARANAGDFKLYALEGEVQPWERSRRAA
jgi:hypothetical protein